MKVINTLKDKLNKLIDAEEMSKKDLTSWPRETKHGMELRKAQAKREVFSLRQEYANELITRIAKILVVGDTSRDAFIKELKRDGAFVYSANQFYEELANVVQPQISYGGVFGPTAYVRLAELVDNFVTDNNLSFRQLKEPVNTSVKSFEDVVSVIKKIVTDAYGDTLVHNYLSYKLVLDAIDKKYAKEVVFFTVVDLTEKEREILSGTFFPNQPVFAIDLTTNDTEDTIKSFTAKLHRQVYGTFRKLGKVD